MASSCKEGYYFCNSSQKCKRIPRGHKVQSDGELVREYVSDWRSDLGENLGIKMPTVRPGQFTSTGGKGKAVDLPKVKTGQFKEEIQGGINVEPYTKDTKFLEVETVDIIKPKALNASDWRSELDILDEGRTTIIKGIKVRGSGHPKDSASGTNENPLLDYSKIRASKETKKETVSASYEADLENLIVEMLEEDIQALYENGFSYEEIAEFYDVKDEFLEEGLVSGAIAGAKIISKVAPKVAKYVAKRGAKDIKTVSKFIRNPQNWKKANQDFDKLAIPAAKGAKNIANFVKQLPARTYNLGKSFRQFADKGYKALKGGAQKIIEPIQKKGQVDRAKYKKYQDLVNRANRLAKSKAEKAGQIVDVSPKIKSLSPGKKSLGTGRENLLNKLRSTVTNIKSKGGSLATVAKDKGSALVSKVKSLAKQAKEKTKQLTGLNPKATLPSSSTASKLTTISKKSNLKGIKTAALTTGIVAGGLTSSKRKDKITADEKGTWSKSKASGYVVDMPGYDPSDKQSPEIIQKINALTYDQMQKDKEKGPSQGDPITINGKKVSVTHSSVYGKETPKTTTPKGRTKLVGANTTWTDRHGNVIAPKAKENKKYKYGRTGSHLKPLEQEEAN